LRRRSRCHLHFGAALPIGLGRSGAKVVGREHADLHHQEGQQRRPVVLELEVVVPELGLEEPEHRRIPALPGHPMARL
jgi:hypothetical protein